MIWILVLLLAIVAIAGGLALSKFLFILLILAVILALLGARSAALMQLVPRNHRQRNVTCEG